IFVKNSDNLSILPFETQQDWEAWLKENHAESKGIWLKIAKKEAHTPSVSYAEALDSALCYGWIDGQKAAFNEKYWLQKFTPRTAKSIWSKANCARAEALITEGRMQPEGLRQIEQAKADGRWERAYESQSKIVIPNDFQSELDKNPKARDFFNSLDSANRYAFLFRIHAVKKPETRSAKIQKFIEMLNQQRKLH
ncbi:MAG TPA: YdeI/OmpD-associated family protein, partial [Ktedonobacteraceae bacterium]|nr:YdeI/OmpD-associated family protein [Ktedonobacteraceae bacterium]